jgi:phosphoadenosine phosphosulfate reductase
MLYQPSGLDEKAALSRERLGILLEEHGPGNTWIAWTGGKDSTVVLSLWMEVLADRAPGERPRAMSIDTGYKFPEVTAFREDLARRWGVEVRVVRPEVDLSTFPVAEMKVHCCGKLKIEPLKKAIEELGATALATGVRADEHASRAARGWRELRDDPEHVLAHPLLHWSEMDVWSYILDRDLPYCELYDQGYRSLGCIPCTAKPGGQGERSGRDPEKEDSLGLLHSLGYF